MPAHDPDIRRTPERNAAEAKIAALRQRGGIFVEAVRATRVPMVVTDPTLPGNPIVFANDSFLILSGYDIDEVLGQAPHFLNSPEANSETIHRFERATADNRDETLEIQHLRKDGSSVWTSLFVSPLFDADGRVVPRHHPPRRG